MCDPASNNQLTQVKVSDALLEEHSDVEKDLHSVICCNGQHNICRDPDHRRLAICSIICGLSCIGIVSLIYSVKSRETRKTLQTQDNLKVKEYSRKALKWGTASIVAWVFLICIFPFLLGLLSYIMTFID
ncbi:hypothetical protein IRJ41_013054 [Triplophysa rosa]|uniref:Transmembrane protein 265 n=1 Tax=Triplophysa rosa TaxID=992332 RepID=A0A9W7WMC0_TRIRA|nr:hypothetical protein IRJ41_013054 [Triplophysa rosa]